jgi:hypothetical protein
MYIRESFLQESVMDGSCFISYWVLVWYVLYMFNLTKYNPKIWLIILSIGVFLISLMLLYYNKYESFVSCIGFNIIIKVIPILTIWNTKILMRDFYVGLLLFIIYNLWIIYINKDIYVIYETMFKNYVNDTY